MTGIMMKAAAGLALGAMLWLSAPLVAQVPAAHAETRVERSNLATVTAFYNAALNDKDAEKAKAYLGPVYVQHNPAAKDGIDGFVGYIGYLKAQFPQNRSEIKRSFVSGDHVILHVHNKRTPESRGNAIMEIFRLEKGKIVEHWDVIQDVPEKAANSNGMF